MSARKVRLPWYERLFMALFLYPISIGWIWLLAAMFNPDVDSGVIWFVAVIQAGWSHSFMLRWTEEDGGF